MFIATKEQKEYAMLVKEYPFSGLLFSMKDGKEMKDILARMSDASKKLCF